VTPPLNRSKKLRRKEDSHMASIDWSHACRGECAQQGSGASVFKDTRLPVATVIENLEDCDSSLL
jgi:hypothetical protein